MSALASFMLLQAVTANQMPSLGGTLSRAYGRWLVDCTLSSLDTDGRVQCSTVTTIGDIQIHARRTGDVIEFHVSSTKCPGQIGSGKVPVTAFKKPRRPSPLDLSGADTILAAALGFEVTLCGSATTSIDADRPNMDLAFNEVVSRRRPADFVKDLPAEKKN